MERERERAWRLVHPARGILLETITWSTEDRSMHIIGLRRRQLAPSSLVIKCCRHLAVSFLSPELLRRELTPAGTKPRAAQVVAAGRTVWTISKPWQH